MTGTTRQLARLLANGATLGPRTRLPILPPAIDADEDLFQARVVELAERNGWLCYHTFDSRRSNPGFPDLVLVRGDVTLFVELKSEKGALSDDQVTWMDALQRARQHWRLWKPRDWPEVVATLQANVC